MLIDWLSSWVTISLAVVTFIYLYLTWNDGYWKKRKVHFIKPSLLFGNYMDVILSRKAVGDLMEDIYKETEGKSFVGFWRFRTPGLMVRDPEVVKSVLMRDFSSFEDNAFQLDPNMDVLFSKNPFFRNGEPWKTTRSLLSPNFTSGKLKPLLPLMEEVSDELMNFLRRSASSSEPDGLETKAVALKYTVEMVARCAFGIKGNSFEDPNSRFRKMVNRIIFPGFWKNVEFMILNFFPFIGFLLRVSWIPKDVDAFFRKIILEVIDYRRNNEITRRDYLQYLMDVKKKALENGKSYDDDDVMGNAITFLTEGSETSAITFSFLLYELARNPDVQEQLRQDVVAARREGGGKLSYEALMEMPLMEQVLQESLRLHAPLRAMEKFCTRDITLRGPDGSECAVDKGTLVVIPVQALHTDEQFYPDAERFDPGRWTLERRGQVPKFAYLPFGEGPRICIGMRFAQLQIKLALAKLLEQFELRVSPRMPARLEQDPTYFLACAKSGLWLRFEPRAAAS